MAASNKFIAPCFGNYNNENGLAVTVIVRIFAEDSNEITTL